MTHRAGVSARVEALRSQLRIDQYERLLAEEHGRLRRFRLASVTERRVASQLEPMSVWGWTLLPDRRWPRSRVANVDMIHVGPGGVLVIDVKAWKEPRVEGGHLYNGEALRDATVDTLLAVTALVEEAVSALGLAPLGVVPIMVFAGRREPRRRLGRVELVGEQGLVGWVSGRPPRLDGHQVRDLVALLDREFPPYDQPLPTAVSVIAPDPVIPRTSGPDPQELVLFDAEQLEQSLLSAALAEPIESWMTWLHPEQVRLVRQSRNGPARIRGPAGTGKTVVGLHRTAYFAATRPGRILYTSFVRTLPTVLRSLYCRLSPETVGRVEFVGLHRWAFDLLRARGVDVRCDLDRAKSLYNRTWAQVGRHGPLGDLQTHPEYWWEEISCVIKGRGITELADYTSLRRVGRGTPLQAEHRAAVWDLFTAHDEACRAEGVRDLNDVLRIALDSIRSQPLDPPYASVVVDEVQDLNQVGVQLLHALVGDRPDGLLLIGDGQQAVYPGGFTLAEAGISVSGRSTVLKVNYRNAAEILDVATAIVAADEFDDLDGTAQAGTRDLQVSRSGGVTVRVDQPGGELHDAALLTAIRQHRDELGVRPGDMAVLVGSRWVAARYRRLLVAEGIAAIDLAAYDGTTTASVKVGTFHRAKGLEFANVYLPRLAETPVDRLRDEADSTYRERVELAHRQLFVGMTRARDLLWLGYCAST